MAKVTGWPSFKMIVEGVTTAWRETWSARKGVFRITVIKAIWIISPDPACRFLGKSFMSTLLQWSSNIPSILRNSNFDLGHSAELKSRASPADRQSGKPARGHDSVV